MNKQDEHRKQIKQKVRRARHTSKPEGENAIVVRDSNGRWLFEMYPGTPPTPGR